MTHHDDFNPHQVQSHGSTARSLKIHRATLTSPQMINQLLFAAREGTTGNAKLAVQRLPLLASAALCQQATEDASFHSEKAQPAG